MEEFLSRATRKLNRSRENYSNCLIDMTITSGILITEHLYIFFPLRIITKGLLSPVLSGNAEDSSCLESLRDMKEIEQI